MVVDVPQDTFRASPVWPRTSRSDHGSDTCADKLSCRLHRGTTSMSPITRRHSTWFRSDAADRRGTCLRVGPCALPQLGVGTPLKAVGRVQNAERRLVRRGDTRSRSFGRDASRPARAARSRSRAGSGSVTWRQGGVQPASLSRRVISPSPTTIECTPRQPCEHGTTSAALKASTMVSQCRIRLSVRRR